MNTFHPSLQQDNIFEFIMYGRGHAVVEACAGSGKTTTAVEGLKLIPQNISVLYLAFNKHIAETLRKKIPYNVDVMTFHSLGRKIIHDHNGVIFDKDKSYNTIYKNFAHDKIMEKLRLCDIPKYTTEEENTRIKYFDSKEFLHNVHKLIKYYKQNLLPVTDESTKFLLDKYFQPSDYEYHILNTKHKRIISESFNIDSTDDFDIYIFLLTKACNRNLKRMKEDSQITDFDDMCWLPIILNMNFPTYDFVFVDEAQDLNPCQIEMLIRLINLDGRIITIGDRHQSLYGFRGADVNAIPNIIKRLNATILPLTTSFRCPISHVKIAKQFVPEIEAYPDAKKGEVINIKKDELLEHVKPDDLVICRYNAPLVDPVFELISQGIKAVIKGKDIGKGLKGIVKRLGSPNITTFLVDLSNWHDAEKERLIHMDKNISIVEDKYHTLKALSVGCKEVHDILIKIDKIFSDDIAQITFSSIHKAKGLEANRVFILLPELMPCIYAKKDWEIEQEENVQYVAYTRSKDTMFLVSNKTNKY